MELILTNGAILLALLFVVGKSALWAVRGAVALSRAVGWSEFTTSFLVVTAISILPETIVSVLSAFKNVPALGLGTLLGSNVADLTFVFGVVALFSPAALKVEKVFIQKDYLFLAFLVLPLVLGFTGHYSRLDGLLLVAGSALFFYLMFRETKGVGRHRHLNHFSVLKGIIIVILSLAALTASAYFTVQYAVSIAGAWGITPALVGLLVIALGTTLPELLFSVRAVRGAHPTLALGDILGTVIADATFVLGITALIHPFSFNPRLVILTGVFMFLAGLFSLALLRSGRKLTRTEGVLLLAFYAFFIIVEFMLRDWTPLITR